MAILPSRGTSQSSTASVVITAQTSHHQRPVFPKRLFGVYPSRLVTTHHLIQTVHVTDTRPHSPTTVAYESITHASIIGSSYTIYGEADHASTCAYRLPSFPIINLAHITSHFLIAFRHIPMTYLTRRASNGHHFSSLSTAVHFLRTTGPCKLLSTSSTCTTPANALPDSNPYPNQTHQHHRRRCHDYDPIRCRQPVVMTLFASAS